MAGLVALLAATVVNAVPSEQDLKRATEKYEKTIADAEATLRAVLQKTSAKTKDKATLTKIAYESERFEKLKAPPTVAGGKEYLRVRDGALAALAAQYEPAIQAKRKMKNAEAADKLEGEYAELVKKGKGFGLAVPDPEGSPLVVIRSQDKESVLEPVSPRKAGSKIVTAKYAQGNLNQVWRLERGEDGITFKSAVSNLYLHVPAGSQAEGEQLVLWGSDELPPNSRFCWKAEEQLREVVLVSSFNELVLTRKLVNEKGEVKTLLTQEKKLTAKPIGQVWRIEVQKP